MQLTITIPEDNRYGVAFARSTHNAGLAATIRQEVDGEVMEVPNPALIDSDEDYVARIVGVAVASWCEQANVAPPPPKTDPVVIDGVPQEVSRRQARQALIQAGKFALVQPAIDAIADPMQRALMQSEWDDSQVFLRQRPALLAMASAIGLTSDELDNLFKLAATL